MDRGDYVSRMPTTIERFEGTAMAVNSYLVRGDGGLVVVDGQLTVSDATALRDRIATTGLPVAALVVTHPHPDHYAGAASAVDESVPIYATRAVDAVIRRDDAEKDAIVGPMMGAEWPTERRFPDRLVDDGSVVELAGLEFTVDDVGPGESHADSVWKLGDDWLIGDVICHDTHAYLADGRYAKWLASLDDLMDKTDAGTRLLVGHGEPTDRSAIAAQRTYIQTFVDTVSGALDLDPQERTAAVVKAMSGLVADSRLQFLMELSIEPVARGMAKDATSERTA